MATQVQKRSLLLLMLIVFSLHPHLDAADRETYDIVIYGGTSAGIAAGIQARAMGKSVIVIEPTDREGGLTTTPLSPLSDPLNGDLKLLTSKANS